MPSTNVPNFRDKRVLNLQNYLLSLWNLLHFEVLLYELERRFYLLFLTNSSVQVIRSATNSRLLPLIICIFFLWITTCVYLDLKTLQQIHQKIHVDGIFFFSSVTKFGRRYYSYCCSSQLNFLEKSNKWNQAAVWNVSCIFYYKDDHSVQMLEFIL